MTTEEYVKQVVEQAPPLTSAQRSRLAELLRPVQRGGAPQTRRPGLASMTSPRQLSVATRSS